MIFNSIGQSITSVIVNLNDKVVTIDAHQMPSGIYYASFVTDDDVLASKAFIKI